MPLKNSTAQYGAVTRFLHWAVFLLFVWQYLSAFHPRTGPVWLGV